MAMVPTLGTKVPSFSIQYKPTKTFDTDLFEMLVGRVVRRCIISDLVEKDHPIFIREVQMIEQTSQAISSHLRFTSKEWGHIPWRLRKIVIITHLRELAVRRVALHGLEEDESDQALEMFFQEDFERIFPTEWMDG